MEIPLLAAAQVGPSFDQTDRTERCAELAQLLNVPPKKVTAHDRGLRHGAHHSHYFRVELETVDPIGRRLTLSLILSSDQQQVFASALPPATTTVEEILELLNHHNIQGIEPLGLARMVEGSLGADSARRWVRIAKGSATDSLCGTHMVSEYLASTEGDVVHTMHGDLASRSQLAIMEKRAEVRATFVHPGQELALNPSRPPADVFGRLVTTPSLRPGPEVRMVQSGLGHKLVAQDYGYLYLTPGPERAQTSLEMGIRSPLEIGTGKLHADFLCLPCGDRSHHPSPMDIQRIIAAHGICCGIDPAACTRVSAALARPHSSTHLETVARGRLPQPGRDGMVSRANGGKGPTSSLLDPVWPTGMSVNEGSVLAVLDAATTGEPGFTVTGDRLDAAVGKPDSLSAGPNVEVEVLHGAKTLFRSTAEGFVVFWDNSVEVVPPLPK